MKVTLNWLKQYVDFNWSPEETTERLTMLGLEVEGVQKISGEFEGIVVAQVLTRDKHPNADKLSLCRVQDGSGERQIVCGAQNFKAGDKVPLIRPGASLPPKPGEKEPFTIKVGKIRGVESHGMLCSPQELGLPDTVDGLLILRTDAKVGQPFAEYLGRARGDVVYDLEITPNRPDLNSVIGIAREIAAMTGNPLRIPEFKIQDSKSKIEELVTVRVEAPDLCPRYNARLVTGVKVGPSPDWLRTSLERVGLRSINNVVDVTNYVMLEIGQPLHAFDFRLLQTAAPDQSSWTVVVRRAAASEKFVTLDGVERSLTTENLLIADEFKGIALAGVMGGINTGIREDTTTVLIESACFQHINIRRTSKQLGLRTDASYRFERGTDVEACEWASRRCAQLIIETAGGELALGVVDTWPQTAGPREVTLHHPRANQLLGLALAPEEMEFFLGQLGLKKSGAVPRPVGTADNETSTSVTFRIPSWRNDLKGEIDLIEEIARMYGVDRIPATPPRGAIGSHSHDAVHDQIAEARRILTGLGLNEAQGQTLVSGAACDPSGTGTVTLANPLSSEMDVLRPSLWPGLLDALRHNASRQNLDTSVFEIGRVFNKRDGRIVEERRVAIALTGRRNPLFWSGDEREAAFDAFDLKGMVEEFLEQFGLRGVAFARRTDATALLLEGAIISLGGRVPLGEMGQLLPAMARKIDLRQPVFLAELNLDLLLAKRNPTRSFKSLPQFPGIRRDIAMIVPESTTHEAVLAAVRQIKPSHLEAVDLFDVFRGKHVPEGQKSLAYAFTYRAQDKTLTDLEVNATHDKIVAQFRQSLQAAVRE